MLASLFRRLISRLGAVDRGTRQAVPAPGKQSSHLASDISRLLQAARERYDAGNLTAAGSLLQDVLLLDGGNRDALYYRGIIAGRLGDYAGARMLLEKAVAQDPKFIDGLNALANIEGLQEQWGKAQDLYRRALALEPDSVTVWCNLGLCLRAAGELDAAESALRKARELAPDFPEALLNLAMVATDLGRSMEARELLQRCLGVKPGLAEAHTGLAHLLLQNGEFEQGWREYEWRFKCQDAERQREYPLPRWDGRPIREQVLLIRAEQGLGDQLMFASCLPHAIARARLCLVECEPRLAGLFARSFPQAKVFPHYSKREPQWQRDGFAPDYQIHLGNLPALFRLKLADFPSHHGYLRADPARVEFWRGRLAGLGAGLKIGISWRGGAHSTRRTLRSLQLAEWLPVLRQKQAAFVSLQYGDCRGEIDALARTAGVTVHHWQEAIDDYDQTAALADALDRVISVQTAAAHLTGTLGKPAWVLVPAIPEWRYMAQGEIMPWYPSMMLLRQHQRGDWRPVIERIAAMLGAEIINAGKTAAA